MAERILTYTPDRDIKISTFGREPVEGELMELDWYYEIPIGAMNAPIENFDIRNPQSYILKFLASRYSVFAGSILFWATYYTIYRDADDMDN